MNKKIISISILTLLAIIAFASPASAVVHKEYKATYYVGEVVEFSSLNYFKLGNKYEDIITAYTKSGLFTVVDKWTDDLEIEHIKLKAVGSGYIFHQTNINCHTYYMITIKER
jgi:hypothetical protein